jgi:hypothetical protein
VSATVVYMSMSLDGFVAGPNEEPGKGSATAGTACTGGTGDTVAITLHMYGADLIKQTAMISAPGKTRRWPPETEPTRFAA